MQRTYDHNDVISLIASFRVLLLPLCSQFALLLLLLWLLLLLCGIKSAPAICAAHKCYIRLRSIANRNYFIPTIQRW